MAKREKRFQVMRTDGETMRTSSDSKFMTSAGASERRQKLRGTLPAGSSDSLQVRETRRKGRS
jgi:hypothetical protein